MSHSVCPLLSPELARGIKHYRAVGEAQWSEGREGLSIVSASTSRAQHPVTAICWDQEEERDNCLGKCSLNECTDVF